MENGQLFYKCKCGEFTECCEGDAATFIQDDGEEIKFVAQCEYCGETINISIMVKDY